MLSTLSLFHVEFQKDPLGVRSVMLWSKESEHPRLISREIIFEAFQPMWSRYLNVTDGKTATAILRSAWHHVVKTAFNAQHDTRLLEKQKISNNQKVT